MYHLKNEAGNVHKVTDSKYKRDALLRDGYAEVTEEPKAKKTEGKVKKAEAKAAVEE